MRGLNGKVVAVTGSAGGIGEAVCARLIDEGASVYALDRTVSPLGESTIVDITDPDAMEQVATRIAEREGRIDGLVAAAGVVEDDIAAEEMTLDEWDRTLGVNLRGLFITNQAFGRRMLAQNSGAIVNISSMSGNHVVNVPQKQCAYNASKAAATALTKSLASEWADRGVRVNAVSPGYVATPLLARKAHQFRQWLDATPQQRMAEPSEIAAAVAFLLSDESGYFCGSELVADGGYSLR
ncbi:SDR family NAD(P)-dependent oxidoreductase [Rhodococcus sp. ACPA1]|uniref:SDR family NAD(P)-dependent oxidoreductase n=1 Tax=Rhodococcus sp. ACPA1 TaxID=2028572 RepID=UPI000BB0DD60|nr:SDR family oxidoreductase [Rhodococcus sp. ACPA1]PBC54784.1 short-chain dehydrogenase [Rhodococcus sp. ACPA1]